MEFFKKIKADLHFNVKTWFLVHPFYFARRNLYKGFENYSSKLSGKLIDIGCGSKPYKKLFNNCNKYIGLEIESDDQKNDDSDYTYDGKTFPFENESFDSAICSQVLEHIFEPTIFLNEINRILKKDSLIIMTVPFIWDEHEQPHDYARYTSFGLKYVLEKHNFEVLEQVKLCNDLSVIAQIINCHIYKKLYHKKNFFMKIISLPMFVLFNLLGICLSLFPKNNDMYLDNFILARKR